jgi:hypothetical protein
MLIQLTEVNPQNNPFLLIDNKVGIKYIWKLGY